MLIKPVLGTRKITKSFVRPPSVSVICIVQSLFVCCRCIQSIPSQATVGYSYVNCFSSDHFVRRSALMCMCVCASVLHVCARMCMQRTNDTVIRFVDVCVLGLRKPSDVLVSVRNKQNDRRCAWRRRDACATDNRPMADDKCNACSVWMRRSQLPQCLHGCHIGRIGTLSIFSIKVCHSQSARQ